jgi:hypothetical protein
MAILRKEEAVLQIPQQVKILLARFSISADDDAENVFAKICSRKLYDLLHIILAFLSPAPNIEFIDPRYRIVDCGVYMGDDANLFNLVIKVSIEGSGEEDVVCLVYDKMRNVIRPCMLSEFSSAGRKTVSGVIKVSI